ncbi:hypothetical protein [Frigoriflavimonas asaccharolytica]|uniref:Lipoprotein n=1 Tax=Frigoriflavimonas asaccharolytica TaxID=2735899 RepID=A0A8J8K860_9FLAO|nr:hypothetical protein [Frigoriflavimonas asaccharolytica]NRS92251.1 hypothetical protein [Frigoriflavimonas asaccharolytica]
MKIRIILLAISLLSLMGCTIPTGFRLQNLTDRIIPLKITFQKPYKEFISGEGIEFYSSNEITIAKNLRNRRNSVKLDFIKIDEKNFIINLPPKSTTEIEKTKNFNYNIDKIEIEGKQRNLGELIANSNMKRDNYIYRIIY